MNAPPNLPPSDEEGPAARIEAPEASGGGAPHPGRSLGGRTLRSSPPIRVRLHRLYPYLLVAPSCLFLLAVFVFPLMFSVNLSLRRVQLFELMTGGKFVWLTNYADALQDPMVWNSLSRTLMFMGGSVLLEFLLGLAIALFLHQRLRFRRVIRSVGLLPLMLTPVVLGITFRILFNYSYGIVNYALGLVGISPVVWLASSPWAMVSVVLTDVWNQTPFITLILLAGLQSIPEEHHEAARVDGAGSLQRLVYVTLPMLRPVIFVALFWRFVGTFRVFDIVFVMTGGGPAESTETLSILVSKLAFNYGKVGYAATVSLGMVMLMMTVAIVYHRFGRVSE